MESDSASARLDWFGRDEFVAIVYTELVGRGVRSWLGEFCDQDFVAVAMIYAAASRNCGDFADFEDQVVKGFSLSCVPFG